MHGVFFSFFLFSVIVVVPHYDTKHDIEVLDRLCAIRARKKRSEQLLNKLRRSTRRKRFKSNWLLALMINDCFYFTSLFVFYAIYSPTLISLFYIFQDTIEIFTGSNNIYIITDFIAEKWKNFDCVFQFLLDFTLIITLLIIYFFFTFCFSFEFEGGF